MSTADITRLGRSLKPALAYGAGHAVLMREHRIVVALQAGLDLQGDVFRYIVRQLGENEHKCLEWVKGLWRSRVPANGNDVMRLLTVRRDEACHPDAAARWMACLCRYLLATPNSSEDHLLPRPQRFLMAISASPWLPLDSSDKCTVCVCIVL